MRTIAAAIAAAVELLSANGVAMVVATVLVSLSISLYSVSVLMRFVAGFTPCCG